MLILGPTVAIRFKLEGKHRRDQVVSPGTSSFVKVSDILYTHIYTRPTFELSYTFRVWMAEGSFFWSVCSSVRSPICLFVGPWWQLSVRPSVLQSVYLSIHDGSAIKLTIRNRMYNHLLVKEPVLPHTTVHGLDRNFVLQEQAGNLLPVADGFSHRTTRLVV